MTDKQVATLRKALGSFVESFAEELVRSERRYWCKNNLEGLLVEGERKSIEPMAKRVDGDDQALQQFVNQSPWEHEAVLAKLRGQMLKGGGDPEGVLVLDDTGLPKQGRHSVGVARQYCGALGKIANCQSLVTWHWTGPKAHWPLTGQLYLPRQWTDDPQRMNKAGVPQEAQCFREKWRIALDLLEEMKPQLPSYRAIVMDAGYGVTLPFLSELERRNERYVAQIPANVAAWPVSTSATLHKPNRNGRPRRHARVNDPAERPRRAAQWKDLFRTTIPELVQSQSRSWRYSARGRGARARLPTPISHPAARTRALAHDRATAKRQLQVLFVQSAF